MVEPISIADIQFSLEVFPPRSPQAVEALLSTVDVYTTFHPSYLTVTFGAGGTSETLDYTRHIVNLVAQRTKLPVAAHIAFANRSKSDIDEIMDGFWSDGVRHVLALRGDMLNSKEPFKPHRDGYSTTIEFIHALRTRYPQLRISVAGYPETHPESPSERFDIQHLARKLDAGADDVVTQFFFDPDVFLRWRDKLDAYGIKAPLTPGLLPILNFNKMLTFAQKCNSNVPVFLHKMFDDIDVESVDHKLLAMNVLSHQLTRLIDNGVKDFHFYTLNDTFLTRHVCQWLRAGF